MLVPPSCNSDCNSTSRCVFRQFAPTKCSTHSLSFAAPPLLPSCSCSPSSPSSSGPTPQNYSCNACSRPSLTSLPPPTSTSKCSPAIMWRPPAAASPLLPVPCGATARTARGHSPRNWKCRPLTDISNTAPCSGMNPPPPSPQRSSRPPSHSSIASPAQGPPPHGISSSWPIPPNTHSHPPGNTAHMDQPARAGRRWRRRRYLRLRTQ